MSLNEIGKEILCRMIGNFARSNDAGVGTIAPLGDSSPGELSPVRGRAQDLPSP
jgi:hypothetical protein